MLQQLNELKALAEEKQFLSEKVAEDIIVDSDCDSNMGRLQDRIGREKADAVLGGLLDDLYMDPSPE